jgi:hypothetical protein
MKTHRALTLLVLFLQALALAQDNPLTPLRQDPKVEKIGLGDVVFKQTRESGWTAVAEAMSSYNWRPQTMDSDSGVVFFRDDGNGVRLGALTMEDQKLWANGELRQPASRFAT